MTTMGAIGRVYLVGAGPGDPGLITVKGTECLRCADVVIYDYLANKRLLNYCTEEAEMIYVGKRSGDAPNLQEYINSLLIQHAKEGKTVVRLKGGDPVIFGRGGEEALALASEGIEYEIIPGVTSATAVPAYAGIPITHRDFASSLAIVTGHETTSKGQPTLPWKSLAGIHTVVFLMGVKNLDTNMLMLIDAGRDPETPAALISWGTYSKQRTVTGKVADIAQKVRDAKIKPPSIAVVGEVIKFRENMNWFETKPLFGRKIIVTRSRTQSSELVRRIEDLGGEAIEFPTIEIAPPTSYRKLDSAIVSLDKYEWLVFTSVNGVKYFFARLFERGQDNRSLHSIKLAAIGEQTAGAIEKRGFKVDLVPEEFIAEGLVRSFSKVDIKGKRILIPRVKKAREILPDGLRNLGAEVDVVPAYEAHQPSPKTLEPAKELIDSGGIDVITFASSSTARNFFEIMGKDFVQKNKSIIACIGPITARTVESFGLEPQIVCEKYTIEELAKDIAAYFNKSS